MGRDPNGVGLDGEPDGIEMAVAHIARVYDYLLGGETNFAVDRERAHDVLGALPGGVDQARSNIRLNRRFLVEAVHCLAEKGIRQFLDVGTGIPNADNVHGAAWDVAPDARVVFVDNDPVVLAHAHQLLAGAPGATLFLPRDVRDVDDIVTDAASVLDFTKPVAVLLVGVLHYLTDDDAPYEIVGRLLDRVASGSYLVVSHLASDIDTEAMADMQSRHNQPEQRAETARFRDHAEVARFFDGLDLLQPGVVRLDEWLTLDEPPQWVPAIYCGIGRKP